MGLIWRNGSNLQKWVTLENWVAFGEMGHTWKCVTGRNGSPLQKCFTFGKKSHTFTKSFNVPKLVTLKKCFYFAFINESHLHKWVTVATNWSLFKMDHIWKTGSQLQEWLTLEELGHIWRNGSRSQKCVTFAKSGETFKNRAVLENFLKLEKNHTSRNRSILLKWATLEKMRHTFKYA